MNNDNYDAETTKQLGRAQAIEAMLSSSGWKYAEEDLKDFILTLKDVSSIDMNAGNVEQQLRDHINAAAILEEWLETLKSQVNNAIIVTGDNNPSKIVERR